MNKLPESTIEEFVLQKLEGKSYSDIRAQLTESGLSEEMVTHAIREIDKRVLQAEIEQGHRDQSRSWNRIGLILSVVGLLLTIGFNMGLILKGIPRLIVYSPFFAGILLMIYGRLLQRKTPDPFKKGPGRIRSKRPYK